MGDYKQALVEAEAAARRMHQVLDFLDDGALVDGHSAQLTEDYSKLNLVGPILAILQEADPAMPLLATWGEDDWRHLYVRSALARLEAWRAQQA